LALEKFDTGRADEQPMTVGTEPSAGEMSQLVLSIVSGILQPFLEKQQEQFAQLMQLFMRNEGYHNEAPSEQRERAIDVKSAEFAIKSN